MTPQEKDLIQAVYDRLARAGGGAKDGEADSFINDQLRRQPNAAYGLTQAVIVLEAGLNQAQQKITDLQRQLDEARGGAAQGGGSFLGGSPWGSGSVPRTGAAPQPQSPYYAPQPMAAAASPWAQPSGGSSFLRNAATMAAGVAGGTLIAEGLTSLFSGHRYGGGFGGYGGGFGGGPEIVEENVTVNNNYYDGDGRGGDFGSQDASYDDSGSNDDSGDFGTDV